MMKIDDIPPAVRISSPGTLGAQVIRSQLELFLRESEFNLKRYPPGCVAELRLGTWEIENVPLVALVLRLARSDAAVFDYQLDVSTPLGTRILQCVAAQNQIDVHLVGDQSVRTLRAANASALDATYLIDKLRMRTPWTPEQAARALDRLNTLYPSSRDLWKNCNSSGNP
jgi:hypothetical protein